VLVKSNEFFSTIDEVPLGSYQRKLGDNTNRSRKGNIAKLRGGGQNF